MTRDYKHRAQPGGGRKRHAQKPPVALWKWLSATILLAGFILFLVNLRNQTPKLTPSASVVEIPIEKQPTLTKPEDKVVEAKVEPDKPHYEFYTILPGQDEMIPDHEVKKLKRSETLKKRTKTINAVKNQYVLQAGSFRAFAQADKLKARLALLGVQAKIETAPVGKTRWNRVKIGPYSNMRSIDHVRSKLHKAGIETVVLRENK